MLTASQVAAALHRQGYKATPQRLAVYAALSAKRWHPDADALYRVLQPQHRELSLATVYKNLEILGKIGLIQVLNTGENSFRYDADTSRHSHLRCLGCGAIQDLCGLHTEAVLQEAAAASGYSISGEQFYFFGLCPACQASQGGPTGPTNPEEEG